MAAIPPSSAPVSEVRVAASDEASTSGGPKRVRASERQYKSEMMFIGQQCHWPHCRREDFLPFRCADCHEHFCSDHFRGDQHACASRQAAYVVPLCPLCHEPPKNWKRDEDPNIAMDAHLTPDRRTGASACPAVDANGKIRSTIHERVKRPNECNERRCRKLMVVPIKCTSCSSTFCPSHRAPHQHDCHSVGSKSGTARPARPAQPASSRAAAIKPSLGVADKRSEGGSSAKAQKAISNPVKAIGSAAAAMRDEHKMDKRARAERSSAIKAMQARHAKGLLTPAEEVKLAEEMANLHTSNRDVSSEGGKECVVI